MTRITRAGLLMLLLVFANGCLHSKVEENWGESYEAHLVWQTANPDAPVTNEPLDGLDPETAMRVADRYYKGQEQQRQREAPMVLIEGQD
jgi:hypothetical protein